MAVTAIVAMLFVVVDPSPSLILHGWAAALALGIDSATAAQQLRWQANILPAMYGIRIVCGASSAANLEGPIIHCGMLG